MIKFLSRHITYNEAIRSTTAAKYSLLNEPNKQQLEAMKLLADKVFEPLREFMREPIIVSSFFRSEAVNAKIAGSSNNSQHTKGEAIDIQAPEKAGYNNADMFYYILKKLDFDQLIWEHGNERTPAWVHVSWSAKGNRKQALRAFKKSGKTVYIPFKQ